VCWGGVRTLDKLPGKEDLEDLEQDLTLVGLVGDRPASPGASRTLSRPASPPASVR
jgi:hypothetical protein